MNHLLSKEVAKYDCLVEASKIHPELDPETTLTFLYLLKTGDELFRVIAKTFKDRSISQGKIMVLMHLRHCPECEEKGLTPAEIADRANVTRATITGLLDGLEKDGFIERKRCDQDRRKVEVKLTSEGISLLNEALPIHYKRIHSLMNCFDSKENHELAKLLIKLNTHIQKEFPEDKV